MNKHVERVIAGFLSICVLIVIVKSMFKGMYHFERICRWYFNDWSVENIDFYIGIPFGIFGIVIISYLFGVLFSNK